MATAMLTEPQLSAPCSSPFTFAQVGGSAPACHGVAPTAQVTLLIKPWHLRDDLDVLLAVEDVVDDFVEEDFLRDRPRRR